MSKLVLVIHDVRSAHNVGSMLRSANGLGVDAVYFTGYTPYPPLNNDNRLPHATAKAGRQIAKTSLGAEKYLNLAQETDIEKLLSGLKKAGYTLAALEQDSRAISLQDFLLPKKLVLVVGNEVEGVQPKILDTVDVILEIPMLGSKESFNVAVSAALALYHLRHLA